jgi:hypothetical protein
VSEAVATVPPRMAKVVVFSLVMPNLSNSLSEVPSARIAVSASAPPAPAACRGNPLSAVPCSLDLTCFQLGFEIGHHSG